MCFQYNRFLGVDAEMIDPKSLRQVVLALSQGLAIVCRRSFRGFFLVIKIKPIVYQSRTTFPNFGTTNDYHVMRGDAGSILKFDNKDNQPPP